MFDSVRVGHLTVEREQRQSCLEVVRTHAKDYRGIGKAVGLESSPNQKFKDAIGGIYYGKNAELGPNALAAENSTIDNTHPSTTSLIQ